MENNVIYLNNEKLDHNVTHIAYYAHVYNCNNGL